MLDEIKKEKDETQPETQPLSKNQLENEDQTLLLISGSKGRENDKNYVKKLANAVVKVFTKHGSAKMRCVGAAAVNNADKAFIIAKNELAKRDIHILLDQSFANVVFNGVEKTGILKEVVETD